jgi:hypothetical protein
MRKVAVRKAGFVPFDPLADAAGINPTARTRSKPLRIDESMRLDPAPGK